MDEPEQPRYRDIELRFDLRGPDGNVFVIIGKIAEAIEAVYGRRPAELFSQGPSRPTRTKRSSRSAGSTSTW